MLVKPVLMHGFSFVSAMDYLKYVDWSHMASALLPLIVAVIVRAILDFHLAHFIVKWFSWFPTAWITRKDPHIIAGFWAHYWESSSPNFIKTTDRVSSSKIRQLHNYCYGVFSSKKKKYVIFGEIVGTQFLGKWYDSSDKLGYYGTFHIELKSGGVMRGRWVGHSHRMAEVNNGDWTWRLVAKKPTKMVFTWHLLTRDIKRPIKSFKRWRM